MSSNIANFKWQERKANTNQLYSGYMSDKRMRKTLSKKLNALQTNPSRWIHEMDDDMLESISEMLKSDDNTNVNMAKDIVFKSKLNYNQINMYLLFRLFQQKKNPTKYKAALHRYIFYYYDY
jgi:hypothetical protein